MHGQAGDDALAPDRLHPLQHQLRHRGAASTGAASRASAATRPTPARRATPARRRCGSTTTRTARDRLTIAAAPPRRRHLRGDRLGHRDRARSPRASRAIRDTHGGDVDPLLRRRRPGEPPRRRLQRAPPARALGSIYSSNALAQEKTGEFWVDGQLFGRPRCHTAPRLRARRGGGLRRQEPVAVARLPARARHPEGDRERPRPRADRHRPAPHRDRRARRLPPPGAARHRRLLPRPRCSACWSQEDLVDHEFLARRTTGADDGARRRSRAVPVADYCARRRRRPRRWCASRRPPHRRARRASSIFEDLGIQQAPHSTLNSYLEKLLYLLTGNFAKRGGDEHPHPPGEPVGGGRDGGPRAPARSAVTASSPASCPANVDPRRDPDRPSRTASAPCSSRAPTRRTRSPTASACARRSTRSTSSS